MQSKVISISPYVAPGLPRKLFDYTNPEDRANEIITKCITLWKVDFTYIKKRTRLRDVVYKRQVLMYLIRTFTNLTYKKIGELFSVEGSESYDHTTIIHAIQTLKNLMWYDESIRMEVETLKILV